MYSWQAVFGFPNIVFFDISVLFRFQLVFLTGCLRINRNAETLCCNKREKHTQFPCCCHCYFGQLSAAGFIILFTVYDNVSLSSTHCLLYEIDLHIFRRRRRRENKYTHTHDILIYTRKNYTLSIFMIIIIAPRPYNNNKYIGLLPPITTTTNKRIRKNKRKMKKSYRKETTANENLTHLETIYIVIIIIIITFFSSLSQLPLTSSSIWHMESTHSHIVYMYQLFSHRSALHVYNVFVYI